MNMRWAHLLPDFLHDSFSPGKGEALLDKTRSVGLGTALDLNTEAGMAHEDGRHVPKCLLVLRSHHFRSEFEENHLGM